jgi:C-methyltransferase
MSQQLPHEMVWNLSTAGYAARCMHVVAELGVADRIDDRPVPVGELASGCAVHPAALDRVLHLLADHGIFARSENGYGHTPASELLRSDHPMSMRPFAQMAGLPFMWGSLSELRHSLRTGRPATELLDPRGIWSYLQDRPDEAEVFGRAMAAKAGAEVAAVLAAYDFGRFAIVADIGGGRGHLLRAVLASSPRTDGVLFDLPEVIKTLDVADPRMSVVAGNFFVDPLPPADAYVLMEILHDWGDEESVAILGAVRRAAREDSTLLVVEGVLRDDDRADPRARTLDLVMLTATGGRERTAHELGALFERAGFRLDRIIDTTSPMRIVEASPALP